MIAFGLKECSSSWFRGKVMDAMVEAQAPLIAST